MGTNIGTKVLTIYVNLLDEILRKTIKFYAVAEQLDTKNSRFSHDVTKIQTTKLSILLRFYFHGELDLLKTNYQTNFRFKRFLGFVRVRLNF